MGIYFSQVDCEEMDGTRIENWGEDGLTASVDVLVDYLDRTDLVADVLGNRWVYPYRIQSRSTAATAAVRPFPGKVTRNGQGIKYEKAVVTLNYTPPEQGDDSETVDLISESIEPNAEFLTLDHKEFRWTDPTNGDELKEAEAPGRLLRSFDYVLTKYEQNSMPTEILMFPGSVNDAAVFAPLLGITFPQETLLYNPPTSSRKIDTDGFGKYTIVYRLSFKVEGWNKFWRTKTQTYEQIFVKDGGLYRNFPLKSFSEII